MSDFNTCLAIVVALVGIWRYRQLTLPMRFIAWLVCFDATTELTAHTLTVLAPSGSNLFLYPVSLGGEGLLLTLAYRQALASPRLSRMLLIALAVYLLFIMAQAWLKLGTAQYFVAAQVVSNLFMLGLAALYFRKLLNDLYMTQLRHDPFFWISVGLVIYTLGNMFIALSSDYVMAHYSIDIQRFVLLGVRNLFNIELYIIYLVALWMRPPKLTS